MATTKKIQAYYDTGADLPCEITAYMHCGKCLEERPSGQSPEEWARLSFGLTPNGWQLRCARHQCNVALITTRLKATH